MYLAATKKVIFNFPCRDKGNEGVKNIKP